MCTLLCCSIASCTDASVILHTLSCNYEIDLLLLGRNPPSPPFDFHIKATRTQKNLCQKEEKPFRTSLIAKKYKILKDLFLLGGNSLQTPLLGFSYTKITEVNLSRFVHRLFREVFTSLVRTLPSEVSAYITSDHDAFMLT